MTKPIETLSGDDVPAFRTAIKPHLLAVLQDENFKSADYIDAVVALAQAGLDLKVAMLLAAASATSSAVASLSPADILDLDPTIMLPKAPSWRTTAGRLKRLGQCVWAKCTANEPCIYVGNTGAIEDVLFGAAETIKSADYFTAPANSASPQYITASGTGAVVAQVGGHALADFSGGVGKLCTFTAGTASSDFTARNIAHAVVAGDIVRVGGHVRFAATGTAYQPRIGLGTITGAGNTNAAVISVAADGTATIASNTASKSGIELFDTDGAGNRIYMVWCDIVITATGTLAPKLNLPANAAGTHVGMLWSVKNPTLAFPDAMPVLEDKFFDNDGIQLGTTTPIEVEWKRLKVGRTSISNGLLIPPRNLATPALPRERKITVRRAKEVTGRAYPLPGPRMGKIMVNGMSDYLGPGYWPISPNLTAGVNAIRSAYADPKRWAVIQQLRISAAGITSISVDNVAFWLRCPIGTATGSTADAQGIVSVEIDPAKVTIGNVLMIGAAAEWSQYYVPASSDVGPGWMGRNAGRFYVSPGAVSGTLVMGNVLVYRSSYGLSTNVAAGQTCTIQAVGFGSDKVTADHVQIGGSGASNLVFGHHYYGNFEACPASFWQTSYEVEVDTGSGWTALSASGLTEANLPTNKRFAWQGTHVSGVVTNAPKPERQLWITMWAYAAGLGATVNKPGYQYRGPSMVYRDPVTDAELYRTQAIPDGSVWVTTDVGTPSAGNPAIRIRHTSVKWTSSTVTTPWSGPLSAGAGSHGDNLQTVGATTWSYDCQNILAVGEGAQGFFASNTSICTGFSARGLFALNSVNALGIYGSGTYAMSGMMIASFSMDRDYNGRQYCPRIDVPAGTMLNLSGLYVSTNSDAPSPMRTVTGTLAAAPVAVATARLTGNTLIASTADQPSATSFLEYFVRGPALKDGKLSALPKTIQLSAWAMEKMPWLKGVVETVRAGVGGMYDELIAQCTMGSPTHFTSVANSAALGTNLTLTPRDPMTDTAKLRGSQIVRGNELEIFDLVNGSVQVVAAIKDAYGTAIVGNYALELDSGERVSIKITV